MSEYIVKDHWVREIFVNYWFTSPSSYSTGY